MKLNVLISEAITLTGRTGTHIVPMSYVGYRHCLEIMFTGDVEESWQEAVPESTHLVPQTFVNLESFSV